MFDSSGYFGRKIWIWHYWKWF